jgi:hypothetical protein
VIVAILRAKTRAGSLVLLAMMAGTAGLFWAEPGASADAALSSVVVSNALPGMIVAPPGVGNGSETGASLDSLGVNPVTASAMQHNIDRGAISGYLRSWSRQANGDAAVVEAYQFQQQGVADAFVASASSSARTQGGSQEDAVGSLPGASVFTHVTFDSGSAFLVLFAQGSDAFVIKLQSPSNDLTVNDAVALAQRQDARVTGSTSAASTFWSSSTAYRAGELLGALAGAGLIIWILSIWFRPRRKRTRATIGAPEVRARAAVGAYPPPPRGTPEAGWLPNPVYMNEQLFWNGSQWAGRRHWKAGAGWVEQVPAHAH